MVQCTSMHSVEFECLSWSCGICSSFGYTDSFCKQNSLERKSAREARSKVWCPKVPSSYLEAAKANPPKVDTRTLHQPVSEQQRNGKELKEGIELVGPNIEEPMVKNCCRWKKMKVKILRIHPNILFKYWICL